MLFQDFANFKIVFFEGVGAAEVVDLDFKLNRLRVNRFEPVPSRQDYFQVCLQLEGRVLKGAAHDLAADLVKLAQPACLRPLVPEHRAPIPNLGLLFRNVLDNLLVTKQSPQHTSSALWPQHHPRLLVIRRINSVHFFQHDVRLNPESFGEGLFIFH